MLEIIIWLLQQVVALPLEWRIPVEFVLWWTVLVNLYSSTMNAKRILAEGEELPLIFLGPLALGGVIGLIIDMVQNWPLTLFTFGHLPRKLTFSSQVQWHVDRSNGRDLRRAIWWGEQLNKFDARHIKRLVEAMRRLRPARG